MNYDAARFFAEIAFFGLSVVGWFFLFQWKRQSADRKDFEKLSGIVTRHDEQFKNVPTQQDVTDLRVGLAEVSGSVNALAAEVHGIRDMLPPLQHSINLINEWLRNNK